MNMQQRSIVIMMLAAAGLSAQNPTAAIVGTVADASGSVVANARVEIRDTSTNEARKLQSDQQDEFIAPNLAPRNYEVTVSKEGFRTLHQTGVLLQLDQQARMVFALKVGSTAQAVEVTASVPLINTENGPKGDVVVSAEMVEMPLNGRDYTDLALLTAGVLPTAEGSPTGSPMAINGARSDNTNFVLDGFNDQSQRDGTVQVQPHLDAMQEFKMVTSGYSAGTGRLAGGVVTMVLKSGGNKLHGSGFEFLRNEFFDARNFFNTTKSALRRNQFGGMLSGPVLIPKVYDGRNRTFFLFSWESYRLRQGRPRLGLAPTEAQKLGD
jgi:hypothetical protein